MMLLEKVGQQVISNADMECEPGLGGGGRRGEGTKHIITFILGEESWKVYTKKQ